MKKNAIVAGGILFLCLFCILVSLPAHAQEYHTFSWEKDRIQRLTKWQFGPFRIYPTVFFRNIGYDDNVYRQRDQDGPISDFTATVSPVLNTFILYKNRVILDFSLNPEYVYFVKTERERALNFEVSSGVKINLFNRFVLSGEYLYERARRRASSEFDVRANQVLNSVQGRFFYETARETSFGLTAILRQYDFEDELAPGQEIYLSRLLNRREQTLNGEFYYRLSPETFLFLTAGYTDYRFDDDESRWRDSYSYQGSGGVRFPILGNVRGTISLGYKRLIPRVGYKKSFTGPIGNTNIEARVRRFIFRGRFSKDVRFSYWTNNAFFVEYVYGAGISFYITQFFRVDYDYSNGDNRYPEKMLIRLPDENYEEIERRDRHISHVVGTVFRIFGNTGVGITLNFWRRNSNDFRWGQRSSLFIGGYITYDF
jgi:hypothetical protein